MISAIILIGTVAAAPVLPEEFYGSVYLNGNQAPAGTLIIVTINGEPRGNLTTSVDGLYGGPDNFDPRLIASSTEEEVNAGHVNVTFVVGGVQAFQIVPFKAGTSEKLDLIANSKAFGTDTTVTATNPSSGGLSGGGGGYVSGGSVSTSTGTSTGTTSGSSIQGTSVTAIPTTQSRSSIYSTIDTLPATPAITVIATTETTPSAAVTTVPATKKAGTGPLSSVFVVASVIAFLCIAGRADLRKRR